MSFNLIYHDFESHTIKNNWGSTEEKLVTTLLWDIKKIMQN